ncbi:MAG: DUF1189 domain-containing protein [Clostridia bacterium]|nr:DUF1189 domain-containing protein [Clostridia bacterium]
METEKIGFFKRVKMAIFNLEQYSIFANEKFSKALKYLFLLIVIVTIVLAIASTIELSGEAGKLIDYVKSEDFPEFELKDGKLEASKILNAYDEEFNSRLIVDTTEDISQETIDKYKKEIGNASYSAILLRDKIIYRFDTTLEEGYETTYNNVTSMIGIKDLTKEKLVSDYLNDDNLFKLKMVLGVYAFLTILLLNIITLFEDILIIGVFGWIASKIAKVSLGIGKSMSLAIYSLTLSIILSTIYSVVYSFTGFEIKYFEVMYMIIAYIYIVAAIMIMKEGNRTAGEAVTVQGVVLKTGEEEKPEDEQEQEEKDKKKKLPDEKDKNEENEEIPENQEENLEEDSERKE